MARLSCRLARFFPQDLPHALREIALLMEARGNMKQALRYAERSCTIADSHKAKYEHAQSALVCAKIRQQLGLENADPRLEEAERELARFHSMVDTAMANIGTRMANLSLAVPHSPSDS